ncbi:hypothetical protein J4206_01920 [Candidatus Woesearchaeota archaeon]|nr:hypothetical protein [Candidatus Woesearchaeota archaeon]
MPEKKDKKEIMQDIKASDEQYLDSKTLEKVMAKPLKPAIDLAMHKFLGVTIDELNKDISDKIETKPLIQFDINTMLSFKAAKKLFKKQFFTKLIQTHYGNVSEVADVTKVDRRSIHRAVNELGIEIKKLRKELLMPNYYTKEAVDTILRGTLDAYKQIIHPGKLEEMYKNVSTVSEDILKSLPVKDLTWKEAEHEFEKEFLRKALLQHNGNISKTAKKIKIRYETLIRKMKKLGVR